MKKRILCVVLLLLCVVSAVSFSAVTTQSSRICRCADSSGAYTVRFSGTHADVTRCASRTTNAGLDLSYTILGACACRDRVVLLCDDLKNDQLIIYIYSLDTDVLENFAVYGMKLYGNTDFCCDERAVYIENHRNNKELRAYSFSGNLLNSYRFDEEITDLFSGYDGGVYAVGNHTLYSLSGGGFTAVSGGTVQPHLSAADSHVLVSDSGDAYVLEHDRIARSFPVDTDNTACSACVAGSRLYVPDGTVINGYDIDTGERVSCYSLSARSSLLYADGDSIIAVFDSRSQRIAAEDFTELNPPAANENHPDDNAGSSSAGSNTNSQSADSGTLSAISSSVYRVDTVNYRITGIAPGTTAAQFKKNMHYSGYTLTLYRDNTEKKSGNVGTAMTAVFTAGNSRYVYELSVIGDLTGEGNRNSRDLNLLMDYLIGAASFNGVYEIAADLNDDQSVNAVDLAILKGLL